MSSATLWAALAAAVLGALPVHAKEVVLCDMPWWNMEWNVVAHDFIGQQFTPSQSRLLYVELLLAEGPSNSNGTSLRLDILQGDPQGAVLGSSQVVELPDGFNEIARFAFDPPLALLPEQLHLFRIVRVGDSGYAMVRGGIGDPCPDTAAWILGGLAEQSDLLFLMETSSPVASGRESWSALKSRY